MQKLEKLEMFKSFKTVSKVEMDTILTLARSVIEKSDGLPFEIISEMSDEQMRAMERYNDAAKRLLDECEDALLRRVVYNVAFKQLAACSVMLDATYKNAIEAWKSAAEKGDASAQQRLGDTYGQGDGVVVDYVEAMKWWRLAAEQGNPDAQNNLGLMYASGDGGTRDYAEAVTWFSLAAMQGHAMAPERLCCHYFDGEGMPRNYVLAHMWGSIAAHNGNKSGAGLRDLAAEKMTQADVEEAQKLACVRMESIYENCGA